MRNHLSSLLVVLGLAACGGETTFIAQPLDVASDAATGDVSSDTALPDAAADTGDAAVDAGADATDVAADVSGDAPSEVNEDTSVDATEDAPSDVPSDVAPPDAASDTMTDTPDVSDDTAQDTAADTADDAPDAVGDTIESDVTDVSPDVTPDAGTDTGGEFVCGQDVTFIGQMFIADDEPAFSPNGGVPSFTPYPSSFDAGLAALRASASTEGETIAVEIPVTRAVVVATSFNSEAAPFAQSSFWVADASGTVRVFLSDDAADASVDIVVGTELSFTATALQTYQGAPQVANATDWVAHATGAAVYVRELGADPLADAEDHIVRVTGIVADDGSPCGGSSSCYALVRDAGDALTLRSASRFLERGDCVTYLGPVVPFGGAFQLDTLNFDWLFDYPTF